jgi:hypothetical protein
MATSGDPIQKLLLFYHIFPLVTMFLENKSWLIKPAAGRQSGEAPIQRAIIGKFRQVTYHI